MHLITTNYSQSWPDKDHPVIFAGEWCLPLTEKQQSDSDNLFQIFQYPWDDPQAVSDDIPYLSSVYEIYLERLTNVLNNYHQVDFSMRSWRLIVGPWLYDFIRFTYDSYSVIKHIRGSKKVSHTNICDFSLKEMIPQSYDEFHIYSSDAFYNHVLFGEIIKFITSIPYSTFQAKFPLCKTQSTITLRDRLVRALKYTLAFAYSNFPFIKKRREVVFVSSYFSMESLCSLQIKLGQLPMPFLFDPKASPKKIDLSKRAKLDLSVGEKNEFFQLLDNLIPYQIPASYMENFNSYRNLAKFLFPRSAKVIFTANAYFYNEAFKFWAAEQTQNHSSKLLISQHGAYGESLWSTEEEHMIAASDFFYTWGWSHVSKNVLPMPATKLAHTKTLLSRSASRGILCVLNADIINNMHSQKPMLSALRFKNYAQEIISIPQKIAPKYRKDFRYRFYHTAYGRNVWGLKSFVNANVKFRFENHSEKRFYDDVRESSLVIVSYHPNATGLETLSANFPTLLYWNQTDYPLRKGVDQYYDVFKSVGIYHDSIQSLADHINMIYPDVMGWWFREDVQEAVQFYCRNFALTCDKTVDAWALEIGKIYQHGGV